LQYVDANGLWHDIPEGDGDDSGAPAEPPQPPPPPPRIAYNTNPDYLFRPPEGQWTDNYRGVPVVVVPRSVPGFGNYAGMFAFNRIYIGSNIGVNTDEDVVRRHSSLVRHEWGHYVQRQMLGAQVFDYGIAEPSLTNSIGGPPFITSRGNPFGYELQLWEITADILGGVPRDVWRERNNYRHPITRNIQDELAGLRYLFMLIEISELSGFDAQRRALAELNIGMEGRLLQLIDNFPCPGTGSIDEAASRNRS